MSIFLIQDILRIIFEYCPITDKRNLTRICKSCYKLSILMSNVEKEFQEMINSTKYLDKMKFTNFDNPLYKYTIELVYDGYTDLVPDRYVIPENRIMHYYHNIYYQTAKNGNLDMLKLMLQIKNPPNLKENIDYLVSGAAKGGHKHILEWIMQKYKVNYRATKYAARGNHFELLKWLYKNNIEISDLSTAYAIKADNMEMLEWVFETLDDLNNKCVYYAVKNNNMNLLKWMYEKDPESLELVCDYAIEEGKIEILKWGMNHHYDIGSWHSFSNATSGGYIEILEFLKREKIYHIEKTTELSINAAQANNFETLKWAYENGFPISSQVCGKAALVGNIEMLKWYREKKGNITEVSPLFAIKTGHFETLKWILKKGYVKMHAGMCAIAAANGHFDILMWLRENRCPWDSQTCEYAAYNGHFSILKWAYEKCCPLTTQCCSNTAQYGYVEILKWLREQGCEWDDKLGLKAYQYNSVYIIDWFTKNGYKINPK